MTRQAGLWWLWAGLMAPLLWLCLAGADADPDALVAASGNWAMAWLAAALVMTPAARLWPALLGWLWLRRGVGLAAAAASLVHLWLYVGAMAAYAEPGGLAALVWGEAATPGILTGWAGLLLLVPPALASRDAAMRRLGAAWKRVQRLAWPAAALALLHMGIVHDGLNGALAVAALVIAAQAMRFFPANRKANP
jgi:sulfoxide reductase heme-binding subunit YedZ